ncbi:MAG: hypothetical protein HZY74_08295 [Brevundimonas sp.]|nr:MAG: hypothetical protein HZY74_08295 [Brevundimonas sp.]
MGFQGIPMPVWAKFAICIVFDLIDMTVGRLMLGVAIFTDVANALIMFALWGPIGLFAAWEAVDVTEQLDGFVPTNTLLAWAAHRRSTATA